MNATDHQTLTPGELAKEWRVDVHRVLGWIRSGALPAANLAGSLFARPRFRITRTDADEFWRSRMIKPLPRPTRKAKTPAAVLDWLGVDL